MNITGPTNSPYAIPEASHSAVEGIREQMTRLDRNAAEIARGDDGSGSFAPGSRNHALVEQLEIVHAVRANARSLKAVDQALGTIIDIKA